MKYLSGSGTNVKDCKFWNLYDPSIALVEVFLGIEEIIWMKLEHYPFVCKSENNVCLAFVVEPQKYAFLNNCKEKKV